MHIKKNTVLPAGIKITRCPPGRFSGPSNWQLAQREEQDLARAASPAPSEHRFEDALAENRAERRAEMFGAATQGGMSGADALGELDGM